MKHTRTAAAAAHYPRLKDQPLGFVVYDGPSIIDGSPIVVIVNRVFTASENEKTGGLVQSFIIRSDVSPVAALKTGDDAGVCGMCPHRPILAAQDPDMAPCYVNVGRSVLAVFNAYKRGRYPVASPEFVAQFLADKTLRLGTYGDPAAAPVGIWETLVAGAAKHVGYTHQWQAVGFDVTRWAPLAMASADTLAERVQANDIGMRTFRVSTDDGAQAGEILCPASAEAGRKTTCDNCRLCGGASVRAKDIVIFDHAVGHKARRVIPLIAA